MYVSCQIIKPQKIPNIVFEGIEMLGIFYTFNKTKIIIIDSYSIELFCYVFVIICIKISDKEMVL